MVKAKGLPLERTQRVGEAGNADVGLLDEIDELSRHRGQARQPLRLRTFSSNCSVNTSMSPREWA